MADERIDVEVTDKISGSVEKKLRDIGDAAGSAHTFVERLKTELGSMNTSALVKLQAASNSTTRALAQQMNAQARLSTATAKSATEDAKAALQKQRLATEAARTAAAEARAAQAATAAAAAAERAAQATQRAAQATSDYAGRAFALKSALDPAFAAQSRFNTEMTEAKALLSAGAINMRTYVSAVEQSTARLNAAQGAQNNFNNGVNRIGQSAGAQRANMANLAAQINDIGVSLASGQNPFIVFIQQGSQISQIAGQMEGGFKALTVAAIKMIVPFLPLVVAVGALYLGFKTFTDEIANNAKPELEAFVQTLGLTRDELKQLEQDNVAITVTMGDSWNGFWATVREGLSIFSDEWDATTSFVGQAWDFTMDFLYKAFVGFYGLVVGGMRGIVKIIANLPSVAAETAKGIANSTLAAIEFLINKVIDGINFVVASSSEVLSLAGVKIDQIGKVNFGRFARNGKDAAQVITGEVLGSVREADRTITAFGQRWDANARTAARSRIGSAAREILDSRTPSGAGGQEADPKTQIDYINETTNALDQELARMRLLKEEREVQQRLDQIEQEFIRRRMPLDQAQLEIFRAKIVAINDYKYVQSELDRITEQAQAPMRTFNAVQTAANDLLKRGTINAEQYGLEMGKAGRALAQATDPLFQFKEELASTERALGLYGDAIQQNNNLETIRQALVAQGYKGDALKAKLLSDEVQGLLARNTALREQQAIQSTVAGIVDPLLDRQLQLDNELNYYSELQRLRDEDVLSTQQYEQAKYQLQAQFSELRLQSTSDFFGQLATLTSSGNKELAAIGKAAAVAQATIDGFLAVQKALASAPPPLNFALAGAVALTTGVQVAGILSTNVGSFNTGGDFMVEGRAGVDNNNINMNVSRGERVIIQTPAQQRAASEGGAGSNVNVPVTVNNMLDREDLAEAVTTSDQFERTVLNIIRSNPRAGGE